MRVANLIEAMETVAPLRYAEPWDRVGLLIGRPESPLTGGVLLTIDLTEPVLQEAMEKGARAIVAYHAPIWEPITRLTSESVRGRILLGCAEAGISVYTPHTALDAAPGGVTDWLCEGLSAGGDRIDGDCRALTPLVEDDRSRTKIVTFVPENDLERVRSALATAGAGHIGGYELCSFSTLGEGTFLGGEQTKPAIGQAGCLETVDERRLEMMCSKSGVALAIETLRKFHPYEEPVIDVYELLGTAQRHVGAGRRLVLDQPTTMRELAERCRSFLDRARIKVALPAGDRPITHIGVVPGAGESLLPEAIGEQCQAFVTGEMRHHQVMEALHAGLAVMLCGHTNTERGYLPRLAKQLLAAMDGVDVSCSVADEDPMQEIS